MKTWVNKLFILCAFSFALFSCEKDEERLVVQPGTATALTASSSNIVLSKDNAAKDALALNWTASNFGFPAGVKYTVEIGKKGANFAEAKAVNVPASNENAISKKLTGAELNTILGQMGMAPGSPADIEVRVKAEISPKVAPVYSNIVTIKATPYLDVIEYTSLYVPGGYQGWSPDKAPKISSVKDDGVYEGYVNFKESSEFKFTSKPAWDGTNYGSGGAGKLSTTGDNLSIPSAGYYRLKANTNEMTWEATKTIWGVIGSATAGGWDSDQNLTYDETTNTWRATLNLTADELKFRANDDWAINFGDTDANGSLEYGGDNIKVKAAGQYEVVLNLGIPGNYNYTVRKL